MINKKNEVKEYKEKSILETFCLNLKKSLEGKIDPIIGKRKEIERTVQILCRRLKNNFICRRPWCRKNSIS